MKRNIFSAIAVAALLLASCSEIDNPPQPNTGKGIGFDIDLSQDWKAEKAGTRKKMRRQPIHAIPMQMSDGGQLWLKAVTTNGIKRSTENTATALADDTRGTPITSLTQMSDFSSFCYKSADNSEFYYNMSSTSEGTLAKKQMWPTDQSLKFFAVHPYDATAANFGGGPETGLTYKFTVNSTVTEQVDLMYATTGDLPYNLEEKAPLHFNHALTAVNFVMGDVRFYGQLKEIKLKNVYTSGTLTLPTEPTTKTGETPSPTWTNLGGNKDVVIDDKNFNITTGSGHVGQTITTGNNVFMMIPQALNNVVVELTFDVSGETITVSGNLSGSAPWEPGTTRTYIINSQKDISEYFFTVSAPTEAVNFDTESTDIEINSFFLKDDGYTREVEWEVTNIEYSGGNGTTNWLGFPEGGDGSETLTTLIHNNFTDNRSERNNVLRNAAPRGTADDPWDLSTHGVKGNETEMNTANCYVISAPGFYKIPLVYGNAIQGGQTAEQSFTSTRTNEDENIKVMKRFQDYRGNEITDPWLKENQAAKMQPGDYFVPCSASLVWSDISADILTEPYISVDKKYLIFEVKADNLTEHGNAVVAVKDGDPDNPESPKTVMWSWHLWFTTPDALETITHVPHTDSKNPENQDLDFHPNEFKITKENLGSKYARWIVSDFTEERQVTITIRQKEAKEGEEKKTATFTIKQRPGRNIETTSTFYQSGRKDAFPGYAIGSGNYFPENSIEVKNKPFWSPYAYYKDAIQNPGTAYIPNDRHDWCITPYYNTWASNQDKVYLDEAFYYTPPVGRHIVSVKTIYDPCPVGFQLPIACLNYSFQKVRIPYTNSLIDFTYSNDYRIIYVQRPYENGWNIYTNKEETETVYFPAQGRWTGDKIENPNEGYYWTSYRSGAYSHSYMRFSYNSFWALTSNQDHGKHALNVRPMAELK